MQEQLTVPVPQIFVVFFCLFLLVGVGWGGSFGSFDQNTLKIGSLVVGTDKCPFYAVFF